MDIDNKKRKMFSCIDELDNNFMAYRGGLKVKEAKSFLNKKMFRVADTPLTYRQINFLDSEGLLKNNRETKNGWRVFSLKELVYLSIIKELRGFGFSNEKIICLKDMFFSGEGAIRTEDSLLSILKGKKNILVLKNENNPFIFNLPNYMVFCSKLKSHININLNEIFSEVLKLVKKKGIDYYDELYYITKKVNNNKKEEEILNLIRSRNYKSITVSGNKNDEFLVKGESIQIVNENKLIEMIKEKKFADINVVKRNGSVVNIKIKEVFKI